MTLQDLLLEQFKVKTRAIVNPRVSKLTGGVDKVLDNNPNRLAWIIINMSGNVSYGSLELDPSVNKGILISANGGSASMIWNEDFDATGWEFYVKGTADSYITVIEIVTIE